MGPILLWVIVLCHLVDNNPVQRTVCFCAVVVIDVDVKTIDIPIIAHYTYNELYQTAYNRLGDEVEDKASVAKLHIDKGFMTTNFKVNQSFKVYVCKVEIEQFDRKVIRKIEIVHEDSEEQYKETVKRLRILAMGAHNRRGAWKEFYKFQERFAEVSYNYALTVHKSQGSSYENCVVDISDINRNKKILNGVDIQSEERNRIKYVAVTRAKKKLFIIN